MVVTIGRNITVSEPSDELIRWCDDNLVIRNPDYIKKQRMNFWLGRTPEFLHLYEWDGDDLVPCLSDVGDSVFIGAVLVESSDKAVVAVEVE